PLNVGQCPLYYNYEPTGRGYDYVDLSGKPQFAFGHGLSYTTFKYSNLHLSTDTPGKHDSVVVSFDITNSGSVAGDEVPQLYLHQEVSSIVRPVMELHAFQRIHLGAGETKSVSFALKPDDMALWSAKMKRVIEPGVFDVMVGSASDDIRLKGN